MDDQREPNEDLDRWLQARVDPLPPPPGTFDLIKRRVRRRRYRQVAVSAAVAAAVAGAVVVVPRVATSVLNVNQNPPSNGAAAAGSATPSTPPAMSQMSPKGGTTDGGVRPASSAPTRPASVPGNFDPTSVTFIGLHTGWVIGQAGTPGHCATQYCTSVARTTDAGQTWTGVPAPLTGAPDGASGVSQIRFLDSNDGWAYGPELFATTDGGQHWVEEGTDGLRVTALETVGSRAFAIMASCTGTGSDFAAQCTNFSLYSTPAGQDAWSPVSGASNLSSGGQASSASLVLTGSQGYLLAPNGSVYTGPVDGSGSWQQASARPADGESCSPGAAQSSGQPSGAFLAAASATSLVLDCNRPAAAGGGNQLFTSSDGGRAWQRTGPVFGATVTAAAAQPGGEIALAATDGIWVSQDGGATWRAAAGSAGLPGGFSWVGLTSSTQGVAIAADSARHEVWFTFSGGQSWQPLAISGP